MKARVELEPQVADFVRSLAPEPRKRLREGLRGLEQDKGTSNNWKRTWLAMPGCGRAVIESSFASLPKAANESSAASSLRSAPWFTNCSPKSCAARPANTERIAHAAFVVIPAAGANPSARARVRRLPSAGGVWTFSAALHPFRVGIGRRTFRSHRRLEPELCAPNKRLEFGS